MADAHLTDHLEVMLHSVDGTRGLIASYHDDTWHIQAIQGFDTQADNERALRFLATMSHSNSALLTITTSTQIALDSLTLPSNAFYSLMAVPIRDGHTLIGGIYIDRPRMQGDFIADDLHKIETASSPIATYLKGR